MTFHLSFHEVKLLFHWFDSYSTYTSFYSTKVPFLFHILFHAPIVLFHGPTYFIPRSWSLIPRKQQASLFNKGWNYVEFTSIPHNSTGCQNSRCLFRLGRLFRSLSCIFLNDQATYQAPASIFKCMTEPYLAIYEYHFKCIWKLSEVGKFAHGFLVYAQRLQVVVSKSHLRKALLECQDRVQENPIAFRHDLMKVLPWPYCSTLDSSFACEFRALKPESSE